MLIGFDADQDCSHVAVAAKTKGVSFVCRYLKNLTAAEVTALHAAGIAIVLIFESTADRALGGAPSGATDGAKALLQAKAFGAPTGVAIYATADFDPTPAQQPTVLEYFAGFDASLAGYYKCGDYANGAICQANADAGTTDYSWLAGGLGMRGSRDFLASGNATLVQGVGDKSPPIPANDNRFPLDLGISIDSDVALVEDYGAWFPPAAIATA